MLPYPHSSFLALNVVIVVVSIGRFANDFQGNGMPQTQAMATTAIKNAVNVTTAKGEWS